jgi:glycosyltransferase involved in cell wall biosynthesis
MKILIFSTAYFPFVGGAEIAVKEITERLGDEIQFDLITARLNKDLPKTEKVGKVNVYRIGVGVRLLDKLILPFWGAAKALRLQKKNNYSAYWCIMATFASGAAYIANWFQKKVPVVLTLQEGDSEEWLRYRWLGLLGLSWRLALKRTRKLTAISSYLLDRAKRMGFKGEAHLVPNGVNIQKFYNPNPKPMSEEVVLITTSRLNVKNGIADAILALKHLPEKVKFRILGAGELEAELKKLTKESNLENRVEFLGLVSPEQIPSHLHEADIFVRPSLSEGMGNSFIEAMAAGLPVIATPVGGIVDFLKDGETGVFCQPKDPESIARAVERLLNDPALVERIKENALQVVKERYDWDLIAREMKSKVFNT